jgi:hypothetical protein
LLVQQHVGIALGIDCVLDSSEPVILVARTLHFTHQPGNFIIYALSYLLARNSHPVVECGKLIVQMPAISSSSRRAFRRAKR